MAINILKQVYGIDAVDVDWFFQHGHLVIVCREKRNGIATFHYYAKDMKANSNEMRYLGSYDTIRAPQYPVVEQWLTAK